jgi:integrating conjugative element protein (TIGR03757 family)
VNVAQLPFVVALVLTETLCVHAWASEDALTIEVFTDSRLRVVGGGEETAIYEIDRIDQLQRDLSRDLPIDAVNAKQLAMQRVQRVDAQLSSELENAAKGLVQAMQYGIDRYPAIVFDGEVVVYGVTDVTAATQLYQRWQTGDARR